MDFIRKHFPDYGDPNVKWLYIVTVLQSAWFQVGNWILYVLLYMSTGTFAVYEAIAFGLGILVEIPSGAFADLFGRRKTVIIGAFLQAFGSLLFTLGFMHNALFFIGNALIIVSFAFRSGAQEALIYDSLSERKLEDKYDDVRGKARSLMSMSIVVASVLGGIGWTVSHYIPWTLCTIIFTFGLLVTLKFKEPSIVLDKPTLKSFIVQNKQGFYYLFKSDFRKYTFSFAMITGSFLMWHTGIIRALMGRDFGYNGETINYLIAFTSLIGFFTAFHFKSIRKKLGDHKGFILVMLVAALAWLVSGLLPASLALGFIVFFSITTSGILAEIWTSIILNNHVHSKHRATAISTLSFLIQIPYVLLAVVFGRFIENGTAGTFYTITGILLAAGLISFYRAEKSKIIVGAPVIEQ